MGCIDRSPVRESVTHSTVSLPAVHTSSLYVIMESTCYMIIFSNFPYLHHCISLRTPLTVYFNSKNSRVNILFISLDPFFLLFFYALQQIHHLRKKSSYTRSIIFATLAIMPPPPPPPSLPAPFSIRCHQYFRDILAS